MGTNNFIALSVIPAGLNQPTDSAAVDLYALVSPNGFSPSGVSVILSGNFIGIVGLIGSMDGVAYRPLSVSFNAGATVDPSLPVTLEFPPQLFTDLVRYVKWRVPKNTKILSNVYITLGGEANCDCTGGGGGPPTGAAGGDLGGTYPNPKVAAITTTTGPTSLVVGAVADNQILKRVGSTVVGVTLASLGTAGNTLIGVVPVSSGGGFLNATATPLLVGSVFFNPAVYPLSGTTLSIKFRAVAVTGNGTIVGHVKIRDVTNSVDIHDFTITNVTPQKLEATFTLGAPGTDVIANADTRYEATIYVTAPSAPTDFIELYGSEFRVINTVN